MEDDILTALFSAVNEHFVTEIVEKNDNNLVFRSNVKNEIEAQRWLEIFSKETRTRWIVNKTSPNPVRFVYRKTWLCQHSKKCKTSSSKRCTNCKASVDIKIRKNNQHTRKNDSFQTLAMPLSTVIKIRTQHNHNVGTTDSVKYLRVSTQVQQQYFDYFDSGMGPSVAMRLHESKILASKPDASKDLANASINPTARTVYNLHDKWKELNVGKVINPLSKLREKLSLGIYESKGMTVKVRELYPWAVIVVTPFMKRAQSLRTSKELIFCDTTSSCYAKELSVTVMLVATKAGATPIAVIIHENQTAEAYIAAFSLLKETFPECFGNASYPELFLTDDSSATKAALKVLWPEAKQLLCHFHVAQAEWRWLFASKNCIPSEERVTLMRLFQKVMCAGSGDDLETAGQAIVNKAEQFPNFVSRFMKFLERGDEWLFLHRKDLLTIDNDTNNFAEATIRTLKDLLLSHTRAFNVVALVEFCTSAWENYLLQRVLSLSHNRNSKHSLMYENLLMKMSACDPGKIRHLGDNVFSIPSGNSEGLAYTVDTTMGLCTCYSGSKGGFCKHQTTIYKCFGSNIPNAPPVTAVDRHSLAYLALGDKCPKLSFFLNLQEDIQCSPPEDKSSLELENCRWTSEAPLSISDTTVITPSEAIHDQQPDKHFGGDMPSASPVTVIDTNSLAYLAPGDKCLEQNFVGLQDLRCALHKGMSSSEPEIFQETSSTCATTVTAPPEAITDQEAEKHFGSSIPVLQLLMPVIDIPLHTFPLVINAQM